MPTSRTSPSPDRILSLLQGYRDAAAMHTAIELELFTRIAHGTDTAGKLASQLGVPLRGVRVLCDYLVAKGLLASDGDELRLADDAAAFLDKQSPAYVGAAAGALYCEPLLRAFENLTESVRAGVSPNPAKSKSADGAAWFTPARGVVDTTSAAAAFVDTLALPDDPPLKILDVGGGSSDFGIALASRHSRSVLVAMDWAENLHGAQNRASQAGLGTRYQTIPGDPVTVPIGFEFDIALLAGSLYRFDVPQMMTLLGRLYYALKKTGELVILDLLTDESKPLSVDSAGMRLSLLAATARGDAYSVSAVKGWLDSAGYRSVEIRTVEAARATLVTAKP